MEEAFYLNNNTYKLFGVIHYPLKNGNSPIFKSKIGIILCSPFAEEKLISQRVMVSLARRLCSEGFSCVRFDYMGHGDSQGNFEDSTVETRISDTLAVKEYLKSKIEIKKVCFLGLRFGATIATLAAQRDREIADLILISPILEGKSYISQVLRSNLTTQMSTYKKIVKNRETLISELMEDKTVNVDGYLLTKQLYNQITGIDLLEIRYNEIKRALLIQISKRKNQTFDPQYLDFKEKYQKNGLEMKLLNIHTNYFWTDTNIYNPSSREIEDAVVGWLSKNI